jgi:hypothetical protein
MLVLGLLWSSFRKLSLGSIGDSLEQAEGKAGAKKGKPEDDLLKWIGELTKDYDVPVTSFKERLQTAPPPPQPPLSNSYQTHFLLLSSFNNGMAWAALIDRFDPDFLDIAAASRVTFPPSRLPTLHRPLSRPPWHRSTSRGHLARPTLNIPRICR